MQPTLSGLSFPPLDDPSAMALSGISMDALLFSLFAGLGILAVVCQFIPGVMLLASMLRSLLASRSEELQPSLSASNSN